MLDAVSSSTAIRIARPIPFSRAMPSRRGSEAVQQAIATGAIKAGGAYTRRCEDRLRADLDAAAVLMLGSCTAALEASAMLLDIGPGDEVIMPSFGFASAPNAFVLRGATPVFVDIEPGTLNLDVDRVAAAITPRTRAIVPVHYAGVAVDLDRLMPLASEHEIPVIEDAAQAIGASYRGRALGSFGALGAISFDATKNVSCGAGGALIVNDAELVERAEWLRDCGTDRAGFSRGHVHRYRWVDAGSNYALNELAAAYLAPQLDDVAALTVDRQAIWHRYHQGLEAAAGAGWLERPVVPDGCVSNAHAYFVVVPTPEMRTSMLRELAAQGIGASFHFVPLHSAPAGLRFGRTHGPMDRTDDLSARLVRLPLWHGMRDPDVDRVIDAVERAANPA
jgi:dTDP-4-amino-4,6-dideoxygalactose transaminase